MVGVRGVWLICSEVLGLGGLCSVTVLCMTPPRSPCNVIGYGSNHILCRIKDFPGEAGGTNLLLSLKWYI